MTKRTMIPLALILIALAIGVAWAAWTRWPPLLEYRIRRADAAMQRVIQEYLDGKQGFEPAATVLSVLWNTKMSLILRLPVDGAPGTGSLTAVQLSLPPGVRPDDPRLTKLGDRAMQLSVGPEAWARLERLKREHGDTK